MRRVIIDKKNIKYFAYTTAGPENVDALVYTIQKPYGEKYDELEYLFTPEQKERRRLWLEEKSKLPPEQERGLTGSLVEDDVASLLATQIFLLNELKDCITRISALERTIERHGYQLDSVIAYLKNSKQNG